MFTHLFGSRLVQRIIDYRLTFTPLPGILVNWSLSDVDVGVNASLTQSYPILLSTLLSVNRNQLSANDATCALTLASSPVMLSLAVASMCDLAGAQTDLYKRIRSHRNIIRVLAALIADFWLALKLTLYYSSGQAFISSEIGIGTDFWHWMLRNIPSGMGVISPIMTFSFLLCLFRRRSQMKTDFRAHREEAFESRRWWHVSWTFVKCAWYIPVVLGAQSTKSNSIQVDCQPQP